MLIDYLTLNYLCAYFWIAIWLPYQLFIHACSEANFRKKYFSANIFLTSSFLVWSVRTYLASSPDTCPTSIKSCFLFQAVAHHFLFSFFLVILCGFLMVSREFSTFHVIFCILLSHYRYFYCSFYSVISFNAFEILGLLILE